MRQQQRRSRSFALPAGSSLLLLTAICAALLSAEPPAGRHALRQFESKVVKAKTILHHLAVASPQQEAAAQIRVLVEDLLEIQPFVVPPVLSPTHLCVRLGRDVPSPPPSPAQFQRPPPFARFV